MTLVAFFTHRNARYMSPLESYSAAKRCAQRQHAVELGRQSRQPLPESEEKFLHIGARRMQRTAYGRSQRPPLGGFALGVAVVLAVALASSVRAEPAIGQFEIKSLDAEPGEIEFQSQNAYALGQPRQKSGLNDEGEWVGDDNSVVLQRHALEVEYGFSHTLKGRLGIEFEKERAEFEPGQSSDAYDELKLDEYAAELIWVAVPRDGDGLGLGVVVEYEHPTESDGSKNLITGPIFEWGHGQWLATFNPMAVAHFGGERNDAGKPDEKIDFTYTARLMYEASKNISWAVEAYGTIDRIGGTGTKSDEAALFGDHNQHRIGPVLYWTRELEGVAASPFRPMVDSNDVSDEAENPSLVFGVGVLLGLNENTPDTTLKLSIEALF